MKLQNISRRDFLKIASMGIGAATLGACKAEKAAPTNTAVPPKPTEPPKPTDTKAPEPTKVEAKPTEAPTPTKPPKPTDTPLPPTPTTPPEPTKAPIVEVEITTNGWPVEALDVLQKAVATDPTQQGPIDATQTWLDNNPGVTIKHSEANIWDPSVIPAMVVAGTDCTILFGPCVGGGWGRQEAVNAFVQGLLADVTSAVVSNNIQGKSLPHIWKSWSANSAVEGKFFSFPLNEYSPESDNLMYRKDLIAAKGLEEPKLGWSFADYKKLMKDLTDPAKNIYGAAHPSWWLPAVGAQHGWDILTQIPQPNEPWHWTRDLTSDPHWVEVLQGYREMLFVDKSVYSDVALGGGDEDYQKLFKAGQCAFVRGNFWSMFGSPTDPTSLAAMADAQGKKYSDMFGAIILPRGDGYQSGGGVNLWGPVSISPNAKPEALDKALNLVDWMFFNKGLDMKKKAIWDIAKDLRAVFNAFLYMDGRTGYEGVAGTATDAWGDGIINYFTEVGKLPYQMQRDTFFPAEKNPAPANTAIDDQLNLMATDPKANNIAELLKKGEDDYKAQLSQFTSSTSTDDFKAAAQKYYAYLDDFLKTNYPEFYQNRFKPYYEGKVLPAIS
jgi:hypothetical protein